MKKLAILLIFLVRILSFSIEYEFDFELKESNKSEIRKGKEIFSVEVRDWWDYPEEDKFNFKYYDNGVLEIIFLDNHKKNLVKIDREYKKIISEELNLFLNTMELDKIKELEESEIFYPITLFSIIQDDERRILEGDGCKDQLLIYENALEEYKRNNKGENPKFIRISKDKSKVFYDVTTNNRNFILSPLEKYNNEKVLKFISFIDYFIEKEKKENPTSILNLKRTRDIRKKINSSVSAGCIDRKVGTKEILKEIKIDNKEKNFEVVRKKYIDNTHWNISKIYISEYGEVDLKIISEINGINRITFKDKRIRNKKKLFFSEKTIKLLSEDDYNWVKIKEINGKKIEGNPILEWEALILEMTDYEEEYSKEPEKIVSKQNIVKNQKPNYKNPKIQKFNEKDIENPIIYEVNHKGYIFRIIGDEKLYENQEIKTFIRYMKSLEKNF